MCRFGKESICWNINANVMGGASLMWFTQSDASTYLLFLNQQHSHKNNQILWFSLGLHLGALALILVIQSFPFYFRCRLGLEIRLRLWLIASNVGPWQKKGVHWGAHAAWVNQVLWLGARDWMLLCQKVCQDTIAGVKISVHWSESHLLFCLFTAAIFKVWSVLVSFLGPCEQ